MIVEYDEEYACVELKKISFDEKPYEVIAIEDLLDAWESQKKIVRCKECKYYHKLYGCQYNDDIDLVTDDDDFCSHGERREP